MTVLISIHALREEGDDGGNCGVACRNSFLSTPSARRATCFPDVVGQQVGHFYPRPPRGGRRLVLAVVHTDNTDFYPRPPRGGRPARGSRFVWSARFLSTPSARRATRLAARQACFQQDFYPRPPRGGRLPSPTARKSYGTFLSTPSARRATLLREQAADRRPISIHALREEGDGGFVGIILQHIQFLSTPSARRATQRPLF